MKKLFFILALLGIVGYAVYAYAWVAGRDAQPVSGTVAVSGTIATTQSGTWTVQPGNTANTTAWKVDGSAVTQPVSGSFWQTTQPVSGTFWQSTQPVSIATMPSTPVTGTFFQGTQPVSIATMPTTTVTATALDVRALASGTDSVTNVMADVTLSDTIIDVTMADTSTVYNVVLPAKTVAYEFQCKGAGVVDFAMSEAGVTTSYWTLKSGYPYNTFGLGSEKLYTGTIYFKCTSPTAGDIFQIRIWTKP